MPEQLALFPSSVVLNGIDYFLLQMDRIMLRTTGKHNICLFVVELADRIESKFLQQQLAKIPAYRWITALRMRRGMFFSLCKWVIDDKAPLPAIVEHQLSGQCSLHDILSIQAIDAEQQPPFKVALLQPPNGGSMLLFTWHHALLDAHGGERLVHYLGSQRSAEQPAWIEPQVLQLPLMRRATDTLAMKRFVYERSAAPLLSLYRGNHRETTLRYRLRRFSVQQSGVAEQRAREHGAGFLISAFYLAAAACAVARLQQRRRAPDGDILVPVPQDQRRRGAKGPLIGNQVSFLFYRLPKTALSDLRTCTTELVRQMTTLMRSGNPAKYRQMMDFLRRVPGPLYRFLLKSPTSGLMGSFFYSDTGNSLQDYQQLFNMPVQSAVHYPPTGCPPGLTFVYSLFRGQLQITIGYMEEVVNSQEMQQLISDLDAALLGEDHNVA